MAQGGLRDDEVKRLLRQYRNFIFSGSPPADAWNAAIKDFRGIEPGVFEAWRPWVIKQAELAGPPDSTLAHTDVLTQIEHLMNELRVAKRLVADQAKQIEALQADLEAKTIPRGKK